MLFFTSFCGYLGILILINTSIMIDFYQYNVMARTAFTIRISYFSAVIGGSITWMGICSWKLKSFQICFSNDNIKCTV